PVFLNRLAAPRWVFSFGMVSSFFFRIVLALLRLRRRGRLLHARPGREDRVQLIAFLVRHGFRHRNVLQLADEPFQDPQPDFRMGVLAAPEEDRRLDLVAFRQEALDVLLLELVVVLVDLRPELDLLDRDRLLMLPRRSRPLLLLILVIAEIHDSAYRRLGGRGDFHQIQSLAPRQLQRLRRRHDAELGSGFVDYAHFTHTDPLVGPDALFAPWAAIVSDNYLLDSVCPLPAAADRPRRATSSSAVRTNSAIGREPRSPPVRLRTETVPSDASRSPTTSI